MNKSVWVAIGLSVGLLLWIMSGGEPENPTAKVQSTKELPLMKVQVTPSQAQNLDVTIVFQGELLPAREVTLKAETSGRVVSVEQVKGSPVREDQKLLTLALDDRTARLDGAKAELVRAQSDLEANRKLFQRGMLSASQLKQDEAQYAAAKSQLSQIKNEISHTQILAPFNSTIYDRFVEVGDYVQAGDPLINVIETNTLKVIGWIPQQKASNLELGQPVSIKLVNDKTLEGRLSFVAPKADPETRAFKVEATVTPESEIKLVGSSVTARVVTEQKLAHYLSPSVISLGAGGELLVKTVNQSQQVKSYPVTVEQTESEGVWLTGMPDSVQVITMGQGFVVDAQQVQSSVVEGALGESSVEQDSKAKSAEVSAEPAGEVNGQVNDQSIETITSVSEPVGV